MLFKNHQNKTEDQGKNTPNHQNTKITVEEILEKVGVCHRLGYGSGCNCLNECFIIRQHLDTKTY